MTTFDWATWFIDHYVDVVQRFRTNNHLYLYYGKGNFVDRQIEEDLREGIKLGEKLYAKFNPMADSSR